MDKKVARIRRATRVRRKIHQLGRTSLVVYRTACHIYAQIITSHDYNVIVSASTVETSIMKQLDNTGNKIAATMIGKIIAERAIQKGIYKVSFDRSGFKYHGRIQALADAARATGLQF